MEVISKDSWDETDYVSFSGLNYLDDVLINSMVIPLKSEFIPLIYFFDFKFKERDHIFSTWNLGDEPYLRRKLPRRVQQEDSVSYNFRNFEFAQAFVNYNYKSLAKLLFDCVNNWNRESLSQINFISNMGEYYRKASFFTKFKDKVVEVNDFRCYDSFFRNQSIFYTQISFDNRVASKIKNGKVGNKVLIPKKYWAKSPFLGEELSDYSGKYSPALKYFRSDSPFLELSKRFLLMEYPILLKHSWGSELEVSFESLEKSFLAGYNIDYMNFIGYENWVKMKEISNLFS